MAEALARGFIDKNMVKAENVVATDPSKGRLQVFGDFGAATADSNTKVCDLEIALQDRTFLGGSIFACKSFSATLQLALVLSLGS